MRGFRDFFLHLLTITIGLLIALGLEGCVEWQHHRRLAHEAEAGLGVEIAQNSKFLGTLRQRISDEQAELDKDLTVLSQTPTRPAATHAPLSFSFRWSDFDDVAWKTAQSTGALNYMPYDDASAYSKIYAMQAELFNAEQQVIDEVLRASSFPSTQPDSWRPTSAQADDLKAHIGLIRMRLLLLSSYVDALDKTYKKFNSEHS